MIAAITANLCTNDRLANQFIQNISFISFISLKLCSEDTTGNSAKKTLAPPLLVEHYLTKPGTLTMNPLSLRLQSGCPVAGATQSVLPAAFAAVSTSALTMYSVSAVGSGKPVTCPNSWAHTPFSSNGVKVAETLARPSLANVLPSLSAMGCGGVILKCFHNFLFLLFKTSLQTPTLPLFDGLSSGCRYHISNA